MYKIAMIANELKPGMVFSRRYHNIVEMVTSAIPSQSNRFVTLTWLCVNTGDIQRGNPYVIHEIEFHCSSIIYDLRDWERLA